MSVVELYVATEWVSAAVQARIERECGRLKRPDRAAIAAAEWTHAQEAVEALMAVGGPLAVAPQTSILVAPHDR